MSAKAKTGPNFSPDGERQRAERQARAAEALRLNLLKRKAQARGRQAAGGAASEADPAGLAGPAPGSADPGEG